MPPRDANRRRSRSIRARSVSPLHPAPRITADARVGWAAIVHNIAHVTEPCLQCWRGGWMSRDLIDLSDDGFVI